MKATRLPWVIVGVGLMVLVLIHAGLQWLRSPPAEQTVLRWSDPDTGIAFEVTEQESGILHHYTRLRVTANGQTIVEQLDLDANFGWAEMVRWGDWLFVVNDGYVLGAYRYSTGKLYGEHDWKELPFTVWPKSGVVVASKRICDHGRMPVNFPLIHAATSQPTSIPQ